MATTTITTKTIFEDTDATFMSRIIGDDGDYIEKSDFDGSGTITYAIYKDGTTAVVDSGPLTSADVVFDTLQTSDARWTVDTTGYNFKTGFAASIFSGGDSTYRLEVKFITDTAEQFFVVFKIVTVEIRTS
tara:strand:- start:255 stop:647 length:393 start_codon:yes stop_codon:yes gene_type:complete